MQNHDHEQDKIKSSKLQLEVVNKFPFNGEALVYETVKPQSLYMHLLNNLANICHIIMRVQKLGKERVKKRWIKKGK